MKSFEEVFGGAPEATGDAPGRVNLLGEHTDYNDGYVLPIAIPQRTRVAVRRSASAHCTLYAASLDRTVTFDLDEPPPDSFSKYVYGCLVEARAEGFDVPPLDIHLSSSVPMGVGLSSSAALEVATLRAVRSLLNLPLDDARLALVAQRAEVKHAGVRCGIMDQMAASLAGTEQALFLDTRTLQRRLISLPPQSAVLVIDSGIKRSLAGSSFNQRRAECEEAARLLDVPALRDVAVNELYKLDALEEPFRSRAQHVVTENDRVLQALESPSADTFGALMNASHASLRDDFDVSVPALDRLVALLQMHSDVYGARLTGAGFGGACVALCRPSAILQIGPQILNEYAADGSKGAILVPPT